MKLFFYNFMKIYRIFFTRATCLPLKTGLTGADIKRRHAFVGIPPGNNQKIAACDSS